MTIIKAITVGERGCDGGRAEARVSEAYVLYFWTGCSLSNHCIKPYFQIFFLLMYIIFQHFKFKIKNK